MEECGYPSLACGPHFGAFAIWYETLPYVTSHGAKYTYTVGPDPRTKRQGYPSSMQANRSKEDSLAAPLRQIKATRWWRFCLAVAAVLNDALTQSRIRAVVLA